MGRIYRKYLEQHVIGCSQCKTHLTTQDDIISRAFHGHFGRAYLVNAVVNSNRFKASETDGHRQNYNSNSASSSPGIRYQITSSPNRYTHLSAGENRRDIFSDNDDEFEAGEDRLMATGMHRVCDIACVQCGLLIGWKYIHAYEESQKYKEDFVDEVVDALSTSLQAQLDCLERKLDSAKCSEKQWHELASLLESTMDKNLDRWEAFVMNNIFQVSQEEDPSNESNETANQHLDSIDILDRLKRRRAEIIAARNIKSKLKQLIKSRELQQQAQREHIAQYTEALGKFNDIQTNYVSREAAVQGTIELNEKITEYDERICALHEVYLESEQRRLAKKSTVKTDNAILTLQDTDMDMENKGDLNLLSQY